MKVWVLMGAWDYEGYDAPVGVFSTLEKAEAAKPDAYEDYDRMSIYEVEVDLSVPWLERTAERPVSLVIDAAPAKP